MITALVVTNVVYALVILRLTADSRRERRYLLDRIQTGDAYAAKALNADRRNAAAGEEVARVDVGTAYGLEVTRGDATK